jgi:hypothetical protein
MTFVAINVLAIIVKRKNLGLGSTCLSFETKKKKKGRIK